MKIVKSTGVTETERLLAGFCERTFLKLWAYPNPFKEDGDELCDLLAVFGNQVFVFFDRENALSGATDKDPDVLWSRWKRNVIDRQVKTAHGAERYLRNGRSIFLDNKKTMPFPLAIDPATAMVHKIIVAHGAKDACKSASERNIYGSLAITYGSVNADLASQQPFHVHIDREHPVHILDSHNLSIVLSELDTVTDFTAYLEEKIRAIGRFEYLSYCGEEDLLGHYLLNFDKAGKKHFIGVKKHAGPFNGLMIGEGEWHSFSNSELYENTKAENRISYFWDDLIQRTCQNTLDGTVGGDADLLGGKSAIYEMVKEPRFVRRGLAQKLLTAVERFTDDPTEFSRQVTYMPSFQANVGYVLLQVHAPDSFTSRPDYRQARQSLLEIACGAAKLKFPALNKIIGIAIDAPKHAKGMEGEDFLLMECGAWTEQVRRHYEEMNEPWQFFRTENMQQFNMRLTEFVPPGGTKNSGPGKEKVGRNDACPCGSGKKFKKCHGA